MHDEKIYEDNWQEVKPLWDLCLRTDVLSLAFIYARYCIYMQEMTGFGTKDCLSPHSLE